MNLLIMSPRKMSNSTKLIIEESKKLFQNVDHVPITETVIQVDNDSKLLYKGNTLDKYDYLIPRIDSKRARYGYKLMKYFDQTNIKKPYNANAITVAHNKFSTIYELRQAGLPVPATWLVGSKAAGEQLIEKLQFPVVIKLVGSSGGKGITFAETSESAKTILNTLDILKQELLIEEYIESKGEDIRILVIGDNIVSMKRIAERGKLKSNVHSGGKAVMYTPTEEEQELAIKAAEAIKSKICAVDMLVGKDGIKIIELNINPGLAGISKARGENIAQIIAKYTYEESKK